MALQWPSRTPDLARLGCGHAWLAKLEEWLCAGWQFVDAEDSRWLDLMLLLHARPNLRTTLVVPEEVASLTIGDIARKRADGPGITTDDFNMEFRLARDVVSPGDVDRMVILIEAGVYANSYGSQGGTLLLAACQEGWTDVVRAFAEVRADLEKPLLSTGDTPLFKAAEHNRLDIMEILLSHRAYVDGTSRHDKFTPLGVACALGHVEAARLLLEAGADASSLDTNHLQALDDVLDPDKHFATGKRLALTQLLAAHGAGRKLLDGQADAVAAARNCGAEETAAWLTRTDKWRTDLHYMEVLPLKTVESMLRRGASLEARIVDKEHDVAGPNGQPPGHDVPTALEVAEELRDAGRAPAGSPAALVLEASGPWSPKTHRLFPAAARARAVTLLMLGRQLSTTFPRESESLFDAWREHVLPHAVHRHAGQELTLRVRCLLPSGVDLPGRRKSTLLTHRLQTTAEEASSLSSLEVACRNTQWAEWANLPAPFSFKWGHSNDGEPVDEASLAAAVAKATMLTHCLRPGGEQCRTVQMGDVDFAKSMKHHKLAQVQERLCLTVTPSVTDA